MNDEKAFRMKHMPVKIPYGAEARSTMDDLSDHLATDPPRYFLMNRTSVGLDTKVYPTFKLTTDFYFTVIPAAHKHFRDHACQTNRRQGHITQTSEAVE